MPDFVAAAVRESMQRAQCEEGDCGTWIMTQNGDYDTPTTMQPIWWVYGRWADEVRIDSMFTAAQQGDQVRVELWVQTQNAAGGGLLIWSGTLTIPATSRPNSTWFTLGVARGPRSNAWGIRAHLLVAPGAEKRRIRCRLTGACTSSALGTKMYGEGVAP